MLPAHGPGQSLETIRLLATLFAATLVLFWRTIAKAAIIAIVAAVIVLIAVGALTLMTSAHH
jgi:hypothetical protein